MMATNETHASLLLTVSKTGDRNAFSILYEHYAPRVKSYLLRGGATLSEVEELVQEVMFRIWKRASSYNPSRASVSTWVFTIARNLRIDRIRKMKHVDVDPSDPALVAAKAPSPEMKTRQRERIQAVREELSSLPKPQAEILAAMYYQGTSQSQLASEMDLPLGTVKSRVRLATKAMRSSLNRFNDTPLPNGDAQ